MVGPVTVTGPPASLASPSHVSAPHVSLRLWEYFVIDSLLYASVDVAGMSLFSAQVHPGRAVGFLGKYLALK